MARREKDYAAADRLRRDLSDAGVHVDDKAGTWKSSDGRSGEFGGGPGGGGGNRRMPTIGADRMHMVDSKGFVSKEAAQAAANAAARGWAVKPPSRMVAGVGANKRALPAPVDEPAPVASSSLVLAGRGAKQARGAGGRGPGRAMGRGGGRH